MTDIKKAPKQFCEAITIGFMKEIFAMTMKSGEEGTTYALTPGHMKRLQQYLTHQIGEYEKQFGEIQTPEWSNEIKSPLQIKRPQE